MLETNGSVLGLILRGPNGQVGWYQILLARDVMREYKTVFLNRMVILCNLSNVLRSLIMAVRSPWANGPMAYYITLTGNLRILYGNHPTQ
jgi:hypothetical protein